MNHKTWKELLDGLHPQWSDCYGLRYDKAWWLALEAKLTEMARTELAAQIEKEKQ